MNTRFFLFFLFLLLISLAGCIMLPVPTGEGKVLAGKPVTNEELSFLKQQVTTQREVVEHLGNPNIIWEDARIFVYGWDMRQGILFWAAGAFYTGAAGMKDIPKHYQLIIRFDEQARVVDFATTTRPLYRSYSDFLTEWLKNSSGKLPVERSDIDTGEKAVVLLNIQCTIDNQPYESFIEPTFTTEPIFLFGVGTFETIGEPKIVTHRFLSPETRRAGWTYLMLSPGVYYLAVLGPNSSVVSKASGKYLQEAPRWRIDIPKNVNAVYVGTLQYTGKSNGELLFGGKIIIPAGGDEPTIRDDHSIASGLISHHFPDAGEAKTILMQRWNPGDPVVIRSSGAVIDMRR